MEPCVYVVDDDRLVRESLEWLLESVNLQTRLYENGQAFLDEFSPGLPGCVVLDVRMPGLNGMELHQSIKHIDPDFPVIIVTGHADVPMAIRAMKEAPSTSSKNPITTNTCWNVSNWRFTITTICRNIRKRPMPCKTVSNNFPSANLRYCPASCKAILINHC